MNITKLTKSEVERRDQEALRVMNRQKVVVERLIAPYRDVAKHRARKVIYEGPRVALVRTGPGTAVLVDGDVPDRVAYVRKTTKHSKWYVWGPKDGMRSEGSTLRSLLSLYRERTEPPPLPLPLFKYEPWGVQFVSERRPGRSGVRIYMRSEAGVMSPTCLGARVAMERGEDGSALLCIKFRGVICRAKTLRGLRDEIVTLIEKGLPKSRIGRPLPGGKVLPLPKGRRNSSDGPARDDGSGYINYIPGTGTGHLPSEGFFGLSE